MSLRKRAEKLHKHWAYALLELVLTAAIALGLAFGVEAFVVKPYRIPTGSMEPTLTPGQRVLVNRLTTTLHVGEIVVFHPPAGAEEQLCGPSGESVTPGRAACSVSNPHQSGATFIKRIVAGPGDEIYVLHGHVYRKAKGTSTFVREQDPYIKACGDNSECDFPQPITIPAGHWFMMGDNRGDSDDSRFWGPVPTGSIVGEAIFTYWPVSRVGTI